MKLSHSNLKEIMHWRDSTVDGVLPLHVAYVGSIPSTTWSQAPPGEILEVQFKPCSLLVCFETKNTKTEATTN